MEYAVRTATFGSFFHPGQICLNTRRIIIQREIYDEFLAKFVARTKTLPADVPLDAAIANEETFGPVVIVEAVDTPDGPRRNRECEFANRQR